jgi:hypothetical protein
MVGTGFKGKSVGAVGSVSHNKLKFKTVGREGETLIGIVVGVGVLKGNATWFYNLIVMSIFEE